MPVFKAGSAFNVVPDRAFMTGTFRSLEDGFVKVFMKELELIVKEVCEKHKC